MKLSTLAALFTSILFSTTVLGGLISAVLNGPQIPGDSQISTVSDLTPSDPPPSDPIPSFEELGAPYDNSTDFPQRLQATECDTSKASPRLNEIDHLIDLLRENKNGNACNQSNMFGSRCTKMVYWKGAAASICGKSFNMHCKDVIPLIKEIKSKCKRDKYYSGGRYYMRDWIHIALH